MPAMKFEGAERTEDGCLIWRGARTFDHPETGRTVVHYRLAWWLAKGADPPAGRRLRHTCARFNCVEVSHLVLADELSFAERFWAKVDRVASVARDPRRRRSPAGRSLPVPDAGAECWLWRGSLDGRGYPTVFDPDRRGAVCAARAARRLLGLEPPPPGRYLFRTCGERRCLNPEHALVRERMRWRPDEAQVREMREMFYARGLSVEQIARATEFSPRTIRRSLFPRRYPPYRRTTTTTTTPGTTSGGDRTP